MKVWYQPNYISQDKFVYTFLCICVDGSRWYSYIFWTKEFFHRHNHAFFLNDVIKLSEAHSYQIFAFMLGFCSYIAAILQVWISHTPIRCNYSSKILWYTTHLCFQGKKKNPPEKLQFCCKNSWFGFCFVLLKYIKLYPCGCYVTKIFISFQRLHLFNYTPSYFWSPFL